MTIVKGMVRIIAIAIACIAIDRLCVEPYQGNLMLTRVDQQTAEMEKYDPRIEVAMAHGNLRDLDQVERSHRLDPQWYLLDAANWEALGEWDRAAEAYTRALRVDDRPEIYFRRGSVMVQMGRVDAALPDLVRAARFDVRYAEQLDGNLRLRVDEAMKHKP